MRESIRSGGRKQWDVENPLAGSPTAPSPLMSGSPGGLVATTLHDVTRQHGASPLPAVGKRKLKTGALLSDTEHIFRLTILEFCRRWDGSRSKHRELAPLQFG